MYIRKNAKTKRDTKLKEGIKDYLPRAGFIRDDDEDKSSRKMGVWGGQGTDDQLRKAKIIVDGKLNPRYIPKISTDPETFKLMLLFDFR